MIIKEKSDNKALYDASRRIDDYLVSLNLDRVEVAAVAAILLLIFNMSFPAIASVKYAREGSFAGIAIAVVFFIAVFLAKRMPTAKTATKKYLYLGFWVLSVIGMSPFWLAAQEHFHVTMNLLCIFGFLLTAVPVFTKKQIIYFFPFFGCYTAMTAAAGGASVLNIVIMLVVITLSAFLTYYLHTGYISVILRLQIESDTDSLTNLRNRRAGLEIMRKTLAICGRAKLFCAVYMIDIDFFKNFNDSFGHLKGDDALRDVARSINEQFSRSADISCRFGGEEFAVMAVVSNEQAAERQAKELLQRVENMKIPAGKTDVSEYLTVSVGLVVFWPETVWRSNDIDIEKILDKADEQLYKAKQSGRNRVCFESISDDD